MDNDEEATLLVEEALFHFAFHRHVNGLGIAAALAAVRNDMGPIAEQMIGRAATVGHILGVHVGDEFTCRAEMHLVGLQDDLIRGISLGMPADVRVASCAVAVYVLHNTFLDEDWVIYGGEGGHLQLANQLHVRVLADQRWSTRNRAMRNSVI